MTTLVRKRTSYPDIRAYVHDHPLYVPNRRTGRCCECGEIVPDGRGVVVRIGRGRSARYAIGHLPIVGVCRAHKEAP